MAMKTRRAAATRGKAPAAKRRAVMKTRAPSALGRRPRSRPAASAPPGLWTALKPGPANFTPLTPISFLPRAAEIHPGRVAVVHGDRRITYAQFYARARRLASALARRGIGRGDTVSAMLPNVPAMLEAHFGVPMLGAAPNTIHTRLHAAAVASPRAHATRR